MQRLSKAGGFIRSHETGTGTWPGSSHCNCVQSCSTISYIAVEELNEPDLKSQDYTLVAEDASSILGCIRKNVVTKGITLAPGQVVVHQDPISLFANLLSS